MTSSTKRTILALIIVVASIAFLLLYTKTKKAHIPIVEDITVESMGIETINVGTTDIENIDVADADTELEDIETEGYLLRLSAESKKFPTEFIWNRSMNIDGVSVPGPHTIHSYKGIPADINSPEVAECVKIARIAVCHETSKGYNCHGEYHY